MQTIRNEFCDKYGKTYNIRNINFSEREDLCDKLGYLVAETKREGSYFFDSENALMDGVYIYKTYYDSTKALRIYKDCTNFPYICHDDVKLLVKLQEKQKDIKLTEFPTGIVTLQDKIIGQEIPLYEDYQSLHDSISTLSSIKQLIIYYKKMLDILIELEQNVMIYTDLHFKNFMVKDNDIKLIDFESNSINLDYTQSTYERMIDLLKDRINYLNEKLNIKFNIEANNLSDIQEEILIKSKKLV